MHNTCIVPFFDVVPPPGPPARQARRAKTRCCGLRRVENWDSPLRRGSFFDCRASARTVQEASDGEADWEQSTAY